MWRVLVLLVATTCTATADQKMALGIGVKSCGAWLESRKTESFATLQFRSWLTGYLTGANMMAPFDFLKDNSDQEAIFAWMDKYCKEQPLEPVGSGAADLIKELAMRTLGHQPLR
jgi:hypothetical protein